MTNWNECDICGSLTESDDHPTLCSRTPALAGLEAVAGESGIKYRMDLACITAHEVLATNGRAAVAIPREAYGNALSESATGLVYPFILDDALRHGRRVEDSSLFQRGHGRDFPDALLTDLILDRRERGEPTLRVNAEYLVAVQRALGVGSIEIHVDGPDRPVQVRPGHDRPEASGFGVVMPVVKEQTK